MRAMAAKGSTRTGRLRKSVGDLEWEGVLADVPIRIAHVRTYRWGPRRWSNTLLQVATARKWFQELGYRRSFANVDAGRTCDDECDIVGDVLGEDVLDRIDQIVPPGVDVGLNQANYMPPALMTAGLRRRPPSERAAA